MITMGTVQSDYEKMKALLAEAGYPDADVQIMQIDHTGEEGVTVAGVPREVVRKAWEIIESSS